MLAWIGTTELILILAVLLLLFGRRLPEVMRSMGRGVHEFKKGVHEAEEELNSAADLENVGQQHDDHGKSSPAG